jgi:cytochrome c oxidase assembly protein subunit 15
VPWLIALALALSLAQLILGTEVREQVDAIAKAMGEANRAQWASAFGKMFMAHRTLSVFILLANAALALSIARATQPGNPLRSSAYALIGLILAEILAGVVLFYAGMPAVAQPLHLVLAALLFGAQFYILILYRMARENPVAAQA